MGGQMHHKGLITSYFDGSGALWEEFGGPTCLPGPEKPPKEHLVGAKNGTGR